MTRSRIILAGSLLFALIGALFLVDRTGKSARPAVGYSLTDRSLPVLVLKKPEDAFPVWKQRGIRNSILLHLGRELHFTPVEMPEPASAPSFPLTTSQTRMSFEPALNAKNFLWLAMRGNIAREEITMLPHDSFTEKVALVQEAVKNGYLGILHLTDKRIEAHELGSKRVITDGFIPPIDEPVLVNVDASIFDAYDPAALYGMLEKARLKPVLITCSLSEDNPSVKSEARRRLKDFAQLVSNHAN